MDTKPVKKELTIEDQIEKAKKAKERADKKLALLNKKQEELSNKNKMDLLNQIIKDPTTFNFLKNQNSIDKDLLNSVHNELTRKI